LAWFLFLLATAGVIAVFVWDCRRKAARRQAESKARFERLFDFREPAGPSAPAAKAGGSPEGAVADTPRPADPAAAPRFLGAPETLAYLLLKTGMPDHEVFARVSLAAIVGMPAAGADRETQVRRLSRYHLDFLICDREMRIVAAIDLDAGGSADTPGERRFKADRLRDAGVRLIRLNASSLPRRDEIRAWVCGAPEAGGAAPPG